MDTKSTRRTFLKHTAPAAMGAGILSTRAFAADQPAKLGANEMINVAIIGCGTRGPSYIPALKNIKDAKVVALCDIHKERLAKMVEKVEGVKGYHDYRKLLEDKSIDAVAVATTGHWHVLPAIHACQAGKDVYV